MKFQDFEKYEIKGPDYDLAPREDAAMTDVSFPPARYALEDGCWKSAKQPKGIFRKKRARILFTGDITCFEKQFEQAKKGNAYDFSYELEKVRPVFEQADLVVGNLETSIFPEAPYRTEKYVSEMQFHCNAPIEFLDAVRKAGFDMVTNANNHAMDTGAIGIGETISYIEKFGLIQTGCFCREKKHYELVEVNGIRIGIVAMATEYNGKKENLTEEGAEFLLNFYTPEKAEALYRKAKADGAEAVFVCIHWGKENKLAENKDQRKKAQELAEIGYDCIIGSHPHVLQPFGHVEAKGKKVPVFYSLGNFLSHNVGNAKGRTAIACIDLIRNSGEVAIGCSYIPAYTSSTVGKKKYVVVPLRENCKDAGNRKRLEIIREIIGTDIGITKDIRLDEIHEAKVLSVAQKVKNKTGAAEKTEKAADPEIWDDGSFRYRIHEDHAVIEKFSPQAKSLAYSVPGDIRGVPVTVIEEEALSGNAAVKKINFSRRIHAFSRGICKGCTSLEGFQTSRQATVIGEEAFAGCTSLQAIVMRKKMERIESRAFAGCTSLRSAKLSAAITFIAEDAFEGCGDFTIYCEMGTYAEEYAERHGIRHVSMVFE